jgi:hypothetical protein
LWIVSDDSFNTAWKSLPLVTWDNAWCANFPVMSFSKPQIRFPSARVTNKSAFLRFFNADPLFPLFHSLPLIVLLCSCSCSLLICYSFYFTWPVFSRVRKYLFRCCSPIECSAAWIHNG